MKLRINRIFFTIAALCLLLPLTGCDALGLAVPAADTPVASVEASPEVIYVTPTSPVAGTPMLDPAFIPTEPARTYNNYQHVSGVFSLSMPQDWEVLDDSTNQRLLVRLLPPQGYGSRITIDITNEGPLNLDAQRALAESYIRLRYGQDSAYTETNRSELPDGRVRILFNYNDTNGGTGLETLFMQQIGPYFAAMRVFLSDTDAAKLSGALDAVVASLSIDELAAWGTRVAAINPAELLVTNTAIWQDRGGITYFAGELYNAAPSDIMDAELKLTFCGEGGVIQAEVTAPIGLTIIERGGSAPFGLALEGLPSDVTVCTRQASAKPAEIIPSYTNALILEPSSGFDDRDNLVLGGKVTNPELTPVTDIEINLAVYDTLGRVVGFYILELGSEVTLQPGESTRFSHTFEELADDAERFLTLSQGRIVNPSNPSLSG